MSFVAFWWIAFMALAIAALIQGGNNE